MSASVLSTNLSNATNNDLDFTAPRDSKVFNKIGVQYLDPGAASQALSVKLLRGVKDGVSGQVISVNLATDSGSAITTIASDISTAINGVKAASVLTSDNTAPGDGDSVTIGGQTYVFKTSLTASTTKNQVLINSTADAALLNLARAINGTGTSGTDYGSLTLPNAVVNSSTSVSSHTITITAKYAGASFNGIALSTSMAVSGSTTTFGGTTLGGSGNTAGVDSTVVDSAGNKVKAWRFVTASNHSGNDGTGLVAAMAVAYLTGSTHESTTGYASVAAAKAEGWIFSGVETTGQLDLAVPQNLHNTETDVWEAKIVGLNTGAEHRQQADSAAHLLISCEVFADNQARKGNLFAWSGPYLDPDTVQR